MHRGLCLLVSAVLFCCGKPEKEQVHAEPHPSATSSSNANGPPETRKLNFVHAAPGDVTTVVHNELVKAKTLHRNVLVYIGAVWCEPCQRFHHAAERGELDSKFPDLTLVEFDLDQDQQRLFSAGYAPQFIPYFGVPKEDGRASGQGFSGSIKGDHAVDDIVPKIEKLLGR